MFTCVCYVYAMCSHGKSTHLRTSSQALALYAEGRIQQQELDRPTHRIGDEHTSSLFVHDEICVC